MGSRFHWAIWLAVALPIVVLFGPVLFTDRSFAFRDASHFYYPLFAWCAREWGAGRVPLWNPYENAGIPALADTSSSLFYPGKLVFALPFDFTLRYKLFIVGHVVLAAFGSYLLARAWRCSQTAAALAAMAYACGGNVVFQYCNVVFLIGAAWLPFAALAADGMLSQRSWRWSLALAAVLALMILGGDPQMALNVLLAAGIYVCLLVGAGNSAAPPEGPRVSRLMKGGWLLAGAAGAAFCLAAVQVLPSSEATRYSERAAFNRPRNVFEAARLLSANGEQIQPLDETRSQSIARGLFGSPELGSHHYLAYSFSVGPWRLAEYLWPNIGGRMIPTNQRWFSLLPAEMRTWTPTLYMGLLPAILGLAGLRLRRGQPHQRWLSWLVVVFTLASFGWYGLGWMIQEVYGAAGGDPTKLGIGPPVGGLYWLMVTLLPSYAYFRYPAKLLPLVALGLSQLAALGWDQAFAERRPKLARFLAGFSLVSAAAAAMVWLGRGVILQFMTQAAPRPDTSLGPFAATGASADLLNALLHAMLVSAAAWWLLREAWTNPTQSWRWQFAALFLTAGELAIANHWLTPTAPAALWREASPVAVAIHRDADRLGSRTETPLRVSRADLGRWRPPSFAQRGSATRPEELARWERQTLFPKHQLPAELGLVQSYGSVKLMDYESLMFIAWENGSPQPQGQRVPAATPLRLLGTEYLVLPESSQPRFASPLEAGGRSAAWPEDTKVWRLGRTLPRAWIVHEIETLPPLPFPLRIESVDARTRQVLYPGGKPRDFSRQAIVETHESVADWRAELSPASGTESCRISTYEPARIVIEATLTRPGLVVLSDAWFPGWEATVQTRGASATQPATIHRTNRVLRGVLLPSGRHTVEMRYRPKSFTRGAAISGASWGLLAILGLLLSTQRRRGRQDSSN